MISLSTRVTTKKSGTNISKKRTEAVTNIANIHKAHRIFCSPTHKRFRLPKFNENKKRVRNDLCNKKKFVVTTAQKKKKKILEVYA
jgi:hypothetical protein